MTEIIEKETIPDSSFVEGFFTFRDEVTKEITIMRTEEELLEHLRGILCKKCFSKLRIINEKTFQFLDQDRYTTEPCPDCAMSLASGRRVVKELGVWVFKSSI